MKKSQLLFILAFAIAMCSCSVLSPIKPVIPTPVEHEQPSMDGNVANSGILGPVPNHGGFYVSPHFMERYNNLIGKYGGEFQTPLHPNDGMTFKDGNIIIDGQHMTYFLLMNMANDSGLATNAPPAKVDRPATPAAEANSVAPPAAPLPPKKSFWSRIGELFKKK